MQSWNHQLKENTRLCVLSLVQLFETPVDYGLPSTSICGIFQARVLEWVAISFSEADLPDTGIEPSCLASPALAGGFFTSAPPGKPSM